MQPSNALQTHQCLELFGKEKAKRCNATEGTLEAICAAVPAAECSNPTPFRCDSWACAENATACEGLFQGVSCPIGQIRCHDGACYTGTEKKDCAKAGVLWQGCPPGLQECPGARGGMCVTDADECKSRPYTCPAGVFCGMQRNTEGKVLMNETTRIPISKCIAESECQVGRDRDPVSTSKLLDSALGGVLEALAEDGKPAMKLNVSKSSFKVGDMVKAVNFSIARVPDSLVQQGSFGKLFRSGALVGSLITIEPSAAVTVIGGVVLDIPILDQEASTDPAKCLAILQNLQMFAVDDITNVTEVPTLMGTCTKGELNCSCAVEIIHFSTYGVIDSGVSVPAVAPSPSAPAPSPLPPPLSAPESSLVLAVKMPYTKAQFDVDKQKIFKEAMASAAGILPLNVEILSINDSRRRQGKSITVETKLRATDSASLQALATQLGSNDAAMLAKINAELTKRGLPASTGVSALLPSPLVKSSSATLSGSSWAFGICSAALLVFVSTGQI